MLAKFDLKEEYEGSWNNIKISVEVLGQEFSEKFAVDKKFANRVGTYEFDRERARLLGVKLQEIGLMIQLQADKGKTQDILVCQGTPNERTIHLF